MTNLTHISSDLKKEIHKIEKKVLPSKKKGFFSILKKTKKLSKKRVWGIAFLSLLIVGLLSIMVLVNTNSDIRHQASTGAYDECIYWSSGSCPNGYANSTNCHPACGTGGACCKTAPIDMNATPTPVVPAEPTLPPVTEVGCKEENKVRDKNKVVTGCRYYVK